MQMMLDTDHLTRVCANSKGAGVWYYDAERDIYHLLNKPPCNGVNILCQISRQYLNDPIVVSSITGKPAGMVELQLWNHSAGLGGGDAHLYS